MGGRNEMALDVCHGQREFFQVGFSDWFVELGNPETVLAFSSKNKSAL